MQPSECRHLRAAAAERLLLLERDDALADPQFWTWDRIDAVPTWCLLPVEDLRTLQRVVGAVFLVPEMRAWIDAVQIRDAEECLGAELFACLIEHADIPDSIHQPGRNQEQYAHTAAVRLSRFEARLMQYGAAVLYASLDPDLPTDRLLPLLGEPGGVLAPRVAGRILEIAARIVGDTSRSPVKATPS